MIVVRCLASGDAQQAYACLKSSRKGVHLYCNATPEAKEYDVVVETSVDASVADLKAVIAAR